MQKILIVCISFFLLGVQGCEEPSAEPVEPNPGPSTPTPKPPTDPSWSVPIEEILDGGPGKDGIPSIDEPKFTDVRSANAYLSDEELVVGIKIGEETKAYPHHILDWHEIVNDSLGGQFYALTYCPLTGTASAWNRKLNGSLTSFGVSGLLYNSNLIPYDRDTDSEWSQLLFSSIHGPNKDKEAEIIQIIETSWKTWKQMYPGTQVLTQETGFDRRYGLYPYGGYRTNNTLIFPVSNSDDQFHPKERFLGVIIGEFASVYHFSAVNHSTVEVRRDVFLSIPLAIVGSEELNFMAAFQTQTLDGTQLNMSAVQDELPIVMKDQEGNKWDIFGEARSGPRKGSKLISPKQTIGYWFSLAGFYPNPKVFE